MITALYAGLAALMLLWLSFRVSLKRMALKVSYGDAGDKALGRAIRLQGNFVEYVPMLLILMGAGEALDAPGWVLHLFGVALIGSRLVYIVGYGSDPQRPALRQIGMTITYLLLLVGGLSVAGHALLG
ncbi:MAPEG family protein [Aliiroseovarius subalbicans]|uniref:MAPEG family protein n=1 Tax=Aliiroseovarius subalbicans TaxID=2925840 RepID=UPI001F5ABA48|nr:MAPEG family protein [Aliiroseovarius subalbicans]MCI2398920.1 MAPEG family protein [Aliiroseovarius subalbicans]